ncbi:hypothetical protein C8F04DRAFT_315671 [Mycena alexandri]|uniref:Uncharacterized protein n=1 Tax=Mycena alexandri TaxID=1745969 RepID=A0AAD6X722_9AGAR|nr:hypothetical protein C8F04DRAFT_315671 [Mycena alexandri]
MAEPNFADLIGQLVLHTTVKSPDIPQNLLPRYGSSGMRRILINPELLAAVHTHHSLDTVVICDPSLRALRRLQASTLPVDSAILDYQSHFSLRNYTRDSVYLLQDLQTRVLEPCCSKVSRNLISRQVSTVDRKSLGCRILSNVTTNRKRSKLLGMSGKKNLTYHSANDSSMRWQGKNLTRHILTDFALTRSQLAASSLLR